MKVILLILFSVIFIANAMEVTNEDTNSPLVPYLLAKVQRLEAKVMAKPNLRNTREVERHSVDTNTSADDKKTKYCPQQVITYIRWGNKTCPYGANTIYQGVAVGGRNNDPTSPSNLMCLPPTWMTYSNDQGRHDLVDAVKYHAHYRNMPCALCEATGRGDKIMIPSHYVCPDGWHKEYNGYIMAGHRFHTGGSMYNCIDEHLEQITGSGSSENVHLLYTVYATGPHVPHNRSYSLSCVVCTIAK